MGVTGRPLTSATTTPTPTSRETLGGGGRIDCRPPSLLDARWQAITLARLGFSRRSRFDARQMKKLAFGRLQVGEGADDPAAIGHPVRVPAAELRVRVHEVVLKVWRRTAPATRQGVRGPWRPRGSSPDRAATVTASTRAVQRSRATARSWHRFVAQPPGNRRFATPQPVGARDAVTARNPCSHGKLGPSCHRLAPRGPNGGTMRMRGLEPPRAFAHTDLNRARLPIPPHPRGPTF